MLIKTLAVAALGLLTSSSAFAAAGGCHTVSGTFVNHTVPCTVVALVCVESQVTGDLAGTSTTAVTTIGPVPHTFSGTVTNALDDGGIVTATIEGTVPADGIGNSVETITGGTRQFAHATGTLTVQDIVPGAGTYTGFYCLAEGDDDTAA
jgi:hypothetical protein